MNEEKKEPYIRWYVPRLRRGAPKVVEISRRNWLVRVAFVVAMWVVLIAFFGLLEGPALAILVAFLAVLIAGGAVFYGWYSGREGVGREPAPLLGRNKRRGV